MDMEFVTVNASGKTRKEIFNDRHYIVAPMTILVGGSVMSGSKGPLLYPPEECAKEPGMWNHIPLTNGHPVDKDGNPVSARSPQVLEKYKLGYVFNDQWDGVKRVAEAWFDVEHTRNRAPEVYQAITNGRSIELSTGLFTNNRAVANGSIANGKAYTHVAVDYKPDHLAILASQTGACSRKDGCGVLIGNACECGRSPEEKAVTNAEKVSLFKQLGEWLGITSAEIKPVEVKTETTTTNVSGDDPMATKKEELVAHLTTNCDCYKGKAEVLNKFDEPTLEQFRKEQDELTANRLVVNTLKEIPEFKDLKINELPAAFAKKAEKAKTCPDCGKEMGEGHKCATTNRLKPASERLTPEEIETLEVAKQLVGNSKAELLTLVVNANGKDDAARAKVRPLFEKLSYGELKTLADNLPKGAPTVNADKGDLLLDFFGNGSGHTNNQSSARPDPNAILLPHYVANADEDAKAAAKASAKA